MNAEIELNQYSCEKVKQDEECIPVVNSFNPATLAKVGKLVEIKPEDLPSKITLAKKAQEHWMSFTIKKRKILLKKAKTQLRNQMDKIAITIHEETGKPKVEAYNTDLIPAISALDFVVTQLDDLFKPRKIKLGKLGPMMRYLGKKSIIYPRPLGIIGIISPWNYPLGIPASQTFFAIAAGNAVILKPSSETPLTATWISKILEDAGLPKDLVQVLPGRGSKIGQAIIESKDR